MAPGPVSQPPGERPGSAPAPHGPVQPSGALLNSVTRRVTRSPPRAALQGWWRSPRQSPVHIRSPAIREGIDFFEVVGLLTSTWCPDRELAATPARSRQRLSMVRADGGVPIEHAAQLDREVGRWPGPARAAHSRRSSCHSADPASSSCGPGSRPLSSGSRACRRLALRWYSAPCTPVVSRTVRIWSIATPGPHSRSIHGTPWAGPGQSSPPPVTLPCRGPAGWAVRNAAGRWSCRTRWAPAARTGNPWARLRRGPARAVTGP